MTLENTTKDIARQKRLIGATLAAAAKVFGIAPETILGKSRHVPIAFARHAAIYAARELSGASYPDLAKAFNRGCHGTAQNSCTVAREQIKIDAGFRARVEVLLSIARQAMGGAS